MKLRQDSLAGLQRSLDSAAPKTLKRGRGYFARGNVLELKCAEPDHVYSAVVRGGADYEVGLEFADSKWAGTCTCPVGVACKHIVAVMLELRKRASGNGHVAPSERESIANRARARWQRVKDVVPVSTQPPRSALSDKLAENLGRDLRQEEANFVGQVQSSYANAGYRTFTGWDLSQLMIEHSSLVSRNYWEPIELWPDFPGDDFYFWLFVAWELRPRNLRWPAFMDGITDLSLIEPGMRQWEHAKEVERWKN